ncbi:MAG TPA: KH domain-containing protein, partial [Microlunatus sp.]|nr:KH domain-containing protein [Microlunatus sp.]
MVGYDDPSPPEVDSLTSQDRPATPAPRRSGPTPVRAEQTPLERRISVASSIDMVNVLGPRDEFLRILERELEADIHVRGNDVTLTGSYAAVSLAADVINEMVTVLRTGQGLTPDAVERI